MQLHEMVKGEGIYLWSKEGKRYIDGSSGPICVNIGHGVKEVTDAVHKQMEQVSYVHSSHFTTSSVKECADKLASLAPKTLNYVFFCSGGSRRLSQRPRWLANTTYCRVDPRGAR